MTAVTSFPGAFDSSVSAFAFQPQPVSSSDADFDSFIDYPQGTSQSPLFSPSPSTKFSPTQFLVDPFNAMLPTDSVEEFYNLPGPSHEYDLFRQQTGLPCGANLNLSTLDDPYGHSMSRQGSFLVPNGYHMQHMSNNPSPLGPDMDFGASSMQAMPANFLTYDTTFDTYVDPTTIDEPQIPVNRLFPGMHSQQAEQAKAEAMARQQRQQQGQYTMSQSQNQPQPFVQQPVVTENTHRQATIQVEDKINRIFEQMRNNSTASSMDEDEYACNEHGPGGKSRKDEEDMDEDERLLASEEGKKLSSKERRQLRNKVSARAFRSRRKEYITQLEGELAGKANECDELKTRNRQLMSQNNQLIELTQKLLRHSAFASVLEDMSNDPSILAPMQNLETASTPVKEEQRNEITHVGMTMVPETSLDFSSLNLGNSGGQGFHFPQTQVFAVLGLPEEPIFSNDVLSGKSADSNDVSAAPKADTPVFAERLFSFAEAKIDGPSVPRFSAEEMDDPSFALYVDASAPDHIAAGLSITVQDASRFLENSLSGKISVRFNLVSTDATIESVDAMFSSLTSVCQRIEVLTASLF